MKNTKLFLFFSASLAFFRLNCLTKFIRKPVENSTQVREPINFIKYEDPFSYNLQYPQTGNVSIDKRIFQIVKDIRTAFFKKYRNLQKSRSSVPVTSSTLVLTYETHIFSVNHLSLFFLKPIQ